jgi:hypothetical protein
MDPAPARVELVIEGNTNSDLYRETMALLDRCGLPYRIGAGTAPEAGGAPRLRWGDEILTEVSREKVVAFLWAHGAQFEDS